MKRRPEPELMDDPGQALAYAEADFSEPHDHFVELFRARFPEGPGDTVLDLGCGPGDICRRFARAYPGCRIHGVDASAPMLALGEHANGAADLSDRITLVQGYLPGVELPQARYRTIISNSLLHHLRDADTLWATIRQFAATGSDIFVMDLLRPESDAAALALVDQYARDEPEVLKRDFHHSLLAAYDTGEIEAQLKKHNLQTLTLDIISDRHFIVWGSLNS